MPFSSRRLVLALVVACVFSTQGSSGAAPVANEDRTQPRRTAFIEKAEVVLTLLDVAVTDEQGRPRPGLKKEDFSVTLNGKDWPIYSVDDLCSCETEPSPSEKPLEADARNTIPGALLPPSGNGSRLDPLRYVLYFEFSQLQMDGRDRAITEAKRWVRETMRAGDEAMIVAYANRTGLREISPFTGVREFLIDAIESAATDPALVDPWPSLLESRMCACLGCLRECDPMCQKYGHAPPNPAACGFSADEEYSRGRRSLRSLKDFLEELDTTPGRKAVLYFNQNGSLTPGGFYGSDPGDLYRLTEEVGAAATSSRASVYPINAGDALDPNTARAAMGTNFGANLADYTGGRFNHGTIDMERVMESAGRSDCCIYRVAIVPPKRAPRGVLAAKVSVAGVAVPWRYRLSFATDLDHWLRDARSVLRHPERAQDLPVASALLPVRADGNRWSLLVLVALDPAFLSFLPDPQGQVAGWQVGALLSRDDGAEVKELLGFSKMIRQEEAPIPPVVHRKEFDALRPGRYKLVAFARGRDERILGGASAEIVLPRAASGGVAGPVLVHLGRHLSSPLPSFTGRAGSETRVSKTAVGPVPSGRIAVERGDVVEAHTWICPEKSEGPRVDPIRFVSRGALPLFRLEATRVERSGSCYEITDRIETEELEPGTYTYHFRLEGAEGKEPIRSDLEFKLVSARTASAGTRGRP